MILSPSIAYKNDSCACLVSLLVQALPKKKKIIGTKMQEQVSRGERQKTKSGLGGGGAPHPQALFRINEGSPREPSPLPRGITAYLTE